MLAVILTLLRSLLSGCQSHSRLALENLALRHQLAVLQRQTRKIKLRPADRLLWVVACGASGHTGNTPCSSSNPKPSSLGIAAAFASSGDGNHGAAMAGPPPTANSSR